MQFPENIDHEPIDKIRSRTQKPDYIKLLFYSANHV